MPVSLADDALRPIPVSVTVLTGFLGSGKTTLLNRLLAHPHGMRLGVLVNDFGSINIDAHLVASFDGDEVNLTNGCVCCSRRGDLTQSMLRLLSRATPPDHLIVEASGIADPVAIAGIFRIPTVRSRLTLDAIVGLVDAENARNPRLDAQLIADQICSADILIVNKIDLVHQDRADDLITWIRSLSPSSRILSAVRSRVPPGLLLGVGRAEEDVNNGGHAPIASRINHTAAYGTWSYRSDQLLAFKKVRSALAELPVSIFRAKGILALADAPAIRFVAHVVGGRVSIDPDSHWDHTPPVTELVFIGDSGATSSEEIEELFNRCATSAIPLMSSRNLARMRTSQRPQQSDMEYFRQDG